MFVNTNVALLFGYRKVVKGLFRDKGRKIKGKL